MNKNVAISFTEGRVVRDFFYNGLTDLLIKQEFSLDIFTPAAQVPSFTRQWSRPEVEFFPLKPYFMDAKAYRAQEVRKRLLKHAPALMPAWLNLEKHLFLKSDPAVVDILKERKPELTIVTNPMQHHEQPVFGAAQSLGIPTLGVIRSWDNLYKGLRIRPDTLAVWNPINREEAIRLMKYSPDRVEIVGATQFDPYFDPVGGKTRAEFAASINLDPGRPIITLATLGAFQHQYDETYLMDWLIDAIEGDIIPKNCQLICRLHPTSRLEQFLKYQEYSFVRLSWIKEYIPSLGWTMTKEDVCFVGNLLRHSDVVISPGSTITIETAIFDTPTIVPVFHTYQPELGKIQFDHHLSTHFRRLKDLDLVPIIDKPEDLVVAINHALKDKSWYRDQRKQLVHDYAYFPDGKSTQRLASLIDRLIQE
jgi:hypothetical protein